MLEQAVAIGQPELGDRQRRSCPSAQEQRRRLEDAGDVRLVRSGVGPDRAADGARDGQPELEAGQAGLLCLRGGARHGHARLGDVPLAVDAVASARTWMTRPRMPGIADDQVAAPAEDEQRQTRRARAKRTSARSSNTLCATANRSAGPPTRIVVKRASGSWRTVLTPIRRWMSVPMRERIESGAAARPTMQGRVIATSRGQAAGTPVDASRRPGSGRAPRGREHELGDGIRGTRPAKVRARPPPSAACVPDRRGASAASSSGRRRSPRPR